VSAVIGIWEVVSTASSVLCFYWQLAVGNTVEGNLTGTRDKQRYSRFESNSVSGDGFPLGVPIDNAGTVVTTSTCGSTDF
jgi:hypothetical protein